MFYCSAGPLGAMFELRPSRGDKIALSEWSVSEKLWLQNAGYSPAALTRIGSYRDTPFWQMPERFQSSKKLIGSKSNKAVHEFLSLEFTRDVPPGEEHQYKISVAIAEQLLGNIKLELDRSSEMPNGNDFAGLQYPAISMRGDADNIVLFPRFADKFLRLQNVRFVRVDDRLSETHFKVTTEAFSKTFQASKILWEDLTTPNFSNQPKTMSVSIEGGLWVTRNQEGAIERIY